MVHLAWVNLELVPAAPHTDAPRLERVGDTVVVGLHVPTGQPGVALCCILRASPDALSQQLYRAVNHRRSVGVMIGMVLLRLLHSHPETSDCVGLLLGLAS